MARCAPDVAALVYLNGIPVQRLAQVRARAARGLCGGDRAVRNMLLLLGHVLVALVRAVLAGIALVQAALLDMAGPAASWGRKCAVWAAVAYVLDACLDEHPFTVGEEFHRVIVTIVAVYQAALAGRDVAQALHNMTVAIGTNASPDNIAIFLGIGRMLLAASLSLLGLATALMAVIFLLNLPQRIPVFGQRGARFANWLEVMRLRLRRRGGTSFGHRGNRPLRLRTDKHVLIMASTRSGKGVALIIPHLLRWRGSAFVLDPKGENARATSRRRAALNGEVHTLDPFGISGRPRSRFNPLSRFTPQNMEAESKALAAALVLVQGERDHWTSSAQQLLAAFIMYVYASDEFPPADKDLIQVRRLLLGRVPETLLAMKDSTLADGLISDLASSFLATPPNEFGSIVLNRAARDRDPG